MKINFKKYKNGFAEDQTAERCAHYIFIVSSKYPYKRSENLTVFDIKWDFCGSATTGPAPPRFQRFSLLTQTFGGCV